jgi:hypothetical protein
MYGTNMSQECSREYESYTDTPYEGKKDDGTVPVGELFGSFFFTNVDNETQELKPNPNSKHFSGLKDYYDGSDGHLLYSVKATKAYYTFLDSGQDLKSYIEQTQGKDAYAQMIQRMGMKLDDGKFDGQTAKLDGGKFDQDMADWLMGELDKTIKQSREEYKANNFPNLDPPRKLDETESQKSSYSKGLSKLPSGSLISASA